MDRFTIENDRLIDTASGKSWGIGDDVAIKAGERRDHRGTIGKLHTEQLRHVDGMSLALRVSEHGVLIPLKHIEWVMPLADVVKTIQFNDGTGWKAGVKVGKSIKIIVEGCDLMGDGMEAARTEKIGAHRFYRVRNRRTSMIIAESGKFYTARELVKERDNGTMYCVAYLQEVKHRYPHESAA